MQFVQGVLNMYASMGLFVSFGCLDITTRHGLIWGFIIRRSDTPSKWIFCFPTCSARPWSPQITIRSIALKSVSTSPRDQYEASTAVHVSPSVAKAYMIGIALDDLFAKISKGTLISYKYQDRIKEWGGREFVPQLQIMHCW